MLSEAQRGEGSGLVRKLDPDNDWEHEWCEPHKRHQTSPTEYEEVIAGIVLEIFYDRVL